MRTLLPVTALTLAVLMLSGCLPRQSTATPTPLPSSTPIFATDEAALAAAEAAYREYLAVSDAIGAEGGANPGRIRNLVTSAWYDKEAEVFATFAATGRRQVGRTDFRSMMLQQYSDNRGTAVIAVYVCTDFSKTSFVDPSGGNLTPVGRQPVVSLEVSFQSAVGEPSALLLSKSEPWSGAPFC